MLDTSDKDYSRCPNDQDGDHYPDIVPNSVIISNQVQVKCRKCGREGTFTLDFPDLFLNTDWS